MREIQLNKMGEIKFNKTYENNEIRTEVELNRKIKHDVTKKKYSAIKEIKIKQNKIK